MVEKIRQGDIPGVQLRCRQRVTASPSEVWQWLAQTESLGRWVADRALAEAPPSQGITLETGQSGDDLVREQIVIVDAQKPCLLVLDLQQLDAGWPVPTRVTFELISDDGGTEVSVLQEGFAHLPQSDCLTIWETYRRRWRTALTRLADLISA